MKILHITPAYYPASYWGGPIFSVYALNNALAQLPRVALRILTTDAAGPKLADKVDKSQLDRDLYPNYEVFFTRRLAGACVSAGLLFRLFSMIRWADVVHLTAIYSFPTIPTLVLCRIFNKPLIWSPRGAVQDAYEWEGTRRKKLKRIWERVCNTLISPGRVVIHTTSERERVATQIRLPRANAKIVPNGVDFPDVLPDRTWLPDGQLRLLFIGRLSPKKGIENLLHAMKHTNDPTVTLSVYGTGDVDYTASLKSLAESLGLLGNTVFFPGKVDGDAKSTAFHSADVCIVPSYTESFCMVVAEALAHDVPVIASHGTPWAEIEEKRCGLWVDNSPASLVRAIVKIRGMELPEMGKRGRAWMKAEYSWNVVAESMQNIYRSFNDG